MPTSPLKVPLTAANITRLLDLLCTDDAFRADFQSNPTAALEQHGLQDPGLNANCAAPACLASKEEFHGARQRLQQQLTKTAAFRVPFFFETGSVYLLPQATCVRGAA